MHHVTRESRVTHKSFTPLEERRGEERKRKRQRERRVEERRDRRVGLTPDRRCLAELPRRPTD
jgi:hypothetical protein